VVVENCQSTGSQDDSFTVLTYDYSKAVVKNSTVFQANPSAFGTLTIIGSKVTYGIWISSNANGANVSLVDSETYYLELPYNGGTHPISFQSGYFENTQIIRTNPPFTINLTRTVVIAWSLRAYGSSVLIVDNAEIGYLWGHYSSRITVNNSLVGSLINSEASVASANRSAFRYLNTRGLASQSLNYCRVDRCYLTDSSSMAFNSSEIDFICYSWGDPVSLTLDNSTLVAELTYSKGAALPIPQLSYVAPPDGVAVVELIEVHVNYQTSVSGYRIKMFYDESELASMGIEERSLSIYEKNASIGTWTISSLQGWNETGDFVWVNVTRFSRIDMRYLLGTPTALAKFRIGDWVQTTANLNVRVGAGLGYTIISTMPLGTIGQILGGPVESDDFVWWDVDYAVGVRGWSAENWLELHVSGAPACVVELQIGGVEISEVDVWEFFNIYAGGSTSDIGMKQIRLSSDEVQDGYPTGEWTDWFDWHVSSEDWNATTKIKSWAFATPGYKEVWAEVRDELDQTAFNRATIFVPAPALPVLTSPLVITPVKDIYNEGDSLASEFNITNFGDVSITLNVLTVGGRLNGVIPPEGAPDFTSQAVTLQPNEPYQYQGSLTLTRRGNYNFFIAYRIDNPTPDEMDLLDENNWNTCMELGEGLTHSDRVKNIIVLEEDTAPEQYVQLKSRINAEITYHLQNQYPPSLLDENSFGNKLGKVWMSFKSFFSKTDLVEQYRQLYHAGKGYQQVAFKSATDAEQAWGEVRIEEARAFLNEAYRYDMMSAQSFAAAAELVDRNLELLEKLVGGVAKGCELVVRYSVKIAYPAAAPIADAFYLALNFGITTKLEGVIPAVKDALLDTVLQLVFFDPKFISLGDNTLLEYVNRVSEFVPLDTILANEYFMQEFGTYLRVVLEERIADLILEETVGLITHWLVSIAESVLGEGKSPVDIRVFDSKGRITGLIDGVVKHEIPMSFYYNGTVKIFFPSDIYRFELVGTDEGTYGLDIVAVRTGNVTEVTCSNIPTLDNATHQYVVDWDALYVGEEGATVMVDTDGDGVVDRVFSSDSEINSEEFIEKTSPMYPTFNLTISAGEGGAVFLPLGTYACSANSTVQVTAIPDEGFALDYWELDSVNMSSNNPCTVLMQENHTLNAVFRLGICDITVANVLPPKSIVGDGYSLNTDVTVANPGDFTETFNITLYANTTVIERIEIILTGGTATSIIFPWNTTGFAYGNYTLWAYVEPIPGETNTVDNTFVYGGIVVTILGDVDGDFDVDIFDIVAVAGAYGSEEGDQTYNPNYDIDGDGDIDIFDIVAAAGHYGESW